MPSKNSIKEYVENGYYHIYNRGVEKRIIFLDKQDYAVFLGYLKEYLLPKDTESLLAEVDNPDNSPQEKDKARKLLRLNNFSAEISLLAYCLMPNHFHLLIKQTTQDSIDKFMNSLGTRYTMYFNKKNKRVGSLYQDVYKAVQITTDEQLLHLTRYIHNQSLSLQGDALHEKHLSSLPDYLGKRNLDWVHPQEILNHFNNNHPHLTYSSFLQQDIDTTILKNLTFAKT